jgi:hypothetical protein
MHLVTNYLVYRVVNKLTGKRKMKSFKVITFMFIYTYICVTLGYISSKF